MKAVWRAVRTLWRWLAGAVAGLALLAALGVGAFRLAIDLLPGYQQRIAAQVQAATGLRLSIDALDARIGRYGPEIWFEGARIMAAGDDQPLVSARAGRASLAIGRSLFYRRLEIGRFVLESPRLNFMIHTDGSIELVGQSSLAGPPAARREPMTLERLPRGLFAVRDATLAFIDLRSTQGPFEVTGADLELERRGDRIDLTGQVELPRHLGTTVEINAFAEGALDSAAEVAWEARIDARALQLDQWAALLPDTIPVPTEGRGSVRVSARGVGRGLLGARLRLDLSGLRLPGSGELYSQIAGDLRVQRQPDLMTLDATGLVLARPGAAWRSSSLRAEIRLADGGMRSMSAEADYLRLENLAPFVSLLPPGKARDAGIALEPSGELFGLDVLVTAAGERSMPDVVGRVRFAGLGFEPLGRAPGVRGLDGLLEGRGAGGVIDLRSQDILLTWPLKWRAVAELSALEGRLEWSRTPIGLRLWLDEGMVDSGHGVARGKLRMLVRPGQTPLMDVSASVTNADVTQAWRWLPVDKLSPAALGWLDAAFRAGRVTEGEVQITGPVRGFPYREGQGRFRARGSVAGVGLMYAPGWPEARDVDAEVEFDGPAMRAIANSGAIGGMKLRVVDASSADLRRAEIAIRADAAGDAADAIRLLRDSPLAKTLGSGLASLAGRGRVEGEVALFLPIKDFARREVTVMATLDDVALRYGEEPEIVTGIKGRFWVRNREVEAPKLSAQVLGGPAEISIRTSAGPAGGLITRVSAEGTMAGERLRTLARLPVNGGIAGTARWRGALDLDRAAAAIERPARGSLRLDSNLQGLVSGLPEPFGKDAAAAIPISLAATFGDDAPMRIRGSLGRNVHALLQWRGNPAAPPIARGVVLFGGETPSALPQEPGLWLAGRLDDVSLSDLLRLEWDRPSPHALQHWFRGADLAIGQLEMFGYGFQQVSGKLRPGNRAWEIEAEAPALRGSMVVPFSLPGDVPMVLDLDRLHVGTRMRVGEGEPDPRRLPVMMMNVRDLRFDGRRFGHVQAELARGTAGLTMNTLSVRHEAFSASGRGSWLVGSAGQQCRFEVELESGNVRGFMEAMNLGSLLSGKRGRMVARVDWPGAPDATFMDRMSGTLEIEVDDGRLVSVEPGAGRVLGLMSLAHLPRRLALDFGDLTGEGLAFDTIRGRFRLASGEASTDNLTLRGAAAEIGLAGKTSLKDRTYDQTAVVTGQLGASLGVAGALAGGPVVGAALLLFTQIFKEPLKGATRGYYRITGSWDDPQVRRIDAREMKEAQAEAAPPDAPPVPGAGGAGN